MLSLLMKYLRD